MSCSGAGSSVADELPFTSIVWFKIKPGMNAEFECAFLEAGMLTRPSAIDGYLGAHLHHSLMHEDEYYVLGSWTTEESYAAWQEVASDGAPVDAIKRMSAAILEHRPNVLMRRID